MFQLIEPRSISGYRRQGGSNGLWMVSSSIVFFIARSNRRRELHFRQGPISHKGGPLDYGQAAGGLDTV